MFELLQIAEGVLRRGDGIFVLDEKLRVVLKVMRLVGTIVDLQVVSKSPRLGIEDRTLLLVMIVGRTIVDGQESGERQKTVLTKVQEVVRARLPEAYVLILKISILVELGETFVEPEWNPGARLAQHIMCLCCAQHKRTYVVLEVMLCSVRRGCVFIGFADSGHNITRCGWRYWAD